MLEEGEGFIDLPPGMLEVIQMPDPITPRDFFAGMAIVGLISGNPEFMYRETADAAYILADAMLVVRGRDR